MGGFYKYLQSSSAGVVIRNDAGLLMGTSCYWNGHVPSIDATEVIAAIQALRFARDFGFHRIVLEADSVSVISKL